MPVIPVYAGETPPDEWHASIFLCGPSPRDAGVSSWRPEALALLEDTWTGPGTLVVFIPEARSRQVRPGYEDQRVWEIDWGDRVDVVVCWLPRRIPDLPALTTNHEFGRWSREPGRAVLGAPPHAEHVRYQRDSAAAVGIPVACTLPDTIADALAIIGDGALRSGGERDVPLLVWRTDSFQSWLAAQRAAGNSLVSARLEGTVQTGRDATTKTVFGWALKVALHIAAEDRVKDNETIISRPDMSCVVAYAPALDIMDTRVVLVREARAPAVTEDGYVHELPGGSTRRTGSARDTAAAEFAEETGIPMHPQRLAAHQVRQAVGTLSTHSVHVFSAELTTAEMDAASHDTTVYGVPADTERTTLEVHRWRDILAGTVVDWTTVGIIASVLQGRGPSPAQ